MNNTQESGAERRLLRRIGKLLANYNDEKSKEFTKKSNEDKVTVIKKEIIHEIGRINQGSYPAKGTYFDKIAYSLKIIKFGTASDIRQTIKSFEPNVDPSKLYQRVEQEVSRFSRETPLNKTKLKLSSKKGIKKNENIYWLSFEYFPEFWEQFAISSESQFFVDSRNVDDIIPF